MAIFEQNALPTEFAANSIVLVNGSELGCYPKSGGHHCNNDSRESAASHADAALRDLFVKNAFLFYRNAYRILSDSRMFLTPVPVQNGMAYIGNSGFKNPTLGVYVEWWLNCEVDMTKDGEGKDALTYCIAGSPLNGNNCCHCTYPDGSVATIAHSPWHPVWKTFVTINKRYTGAKAQYEAYTLPEVVDMLQSVVETRESQLVNQLTIEEGRYNVLKNKYGQLNEQYARLQSRCDSIAMLCRERKLEEFREEYFARKEKAMQETASILETKEMYRSQLRQGLLTNVQYQHLVAPLTCRQKGIEAALASFKINKVNELVNDEHIPYFLIEQCLCAENAGEDL